MGLHDVGNAFLTGMKKATTRTAGALGTALAKPRAPRSAEALTIEPSARTFYDVVTNVLIQAIGLLAPLIIAIVLSMGNGYFFSGFKDFTTADPLILTAYAGGAVLEAIGLGLVYRAARRYRKEEYKGMMFVLLWLLVLMVISIFAQYMFLQSLYVNGVLHVPDTAAEHAPLFSWLVGVGGMRGHDIVFIVRALAFHIGELACSFIVVDKAKTAAQIIAERREIHDAQIALERQDFQLQREKDEAVQDAQIKRLQHQWLLNQVRSGMTYVQADESAVTGQLLPEPKAASPLALPELNTSATQNGNGNGH